MQHLAKWFIILGVILVILGIVFLLFGHKLTWLGHLPGDIRIEKEHFRFYFPITTMILLSILLTVIIRLIQKLF
jgi:hypothetical protein